MKTKIIGILICMLLIATAVPAVKSLNESKSYPTSPNDPTDPPGNWTQIKKLLASDGASYDFFGISVSFYGDTALIGAYQDDDKGLNSGSAYVFIRSGTNWTQQQKLTASDGAASDEFGISVALSGDTALIGAYDCNGNIGSAYVFVRSGSTWTQQQQLNASDGATNDYFGGSVRLDGNTALIGASGHNNSKGVAYVFTRTGTTWTQQAKLFASDSAANDYFGSSVSLSGDTALISATGDDDKGDMSGSAYVFIRSGTTWTQQAKLHATDGAPYDAFGFVSLNADTALIGVMWHDSGIGSAYVFTRTGTNWTQQAELHASDGATNDYFGGAASLFGDTALIGAYGDDDNGSTSGSAYIFTRSGTTWTQQQKLHASDGAASNQFGISVSLSGDTALIGAKSVSMYKGAAYVFIKPSENQPPIFGTPTPANGSTNRPLNLTWSISIKDPNGNHFTYTIQCSNGQTKSKTNQTNGTKSLSLTGLALATTYKVWVNATDPLGSGLYTRRWYTFTTVSNQLPNKPTTPTGPAALFTGQIGKFFTSTTDPDGDQVQYRFDWNASGSHLYSGWTSLVPSGQTVNKTHSWSVPGTYVVKAQARDEHGAKSTWSDGLTVTVTVNHPPNQPQLPTGPATRHVGQAGTYWANGTDPDGDQIQYRFDWNASGSHSYSSWTSLVNSGTPLSKNHAWTVAGTYVVKVQSRDEHGTTSVWSNGLTVIVHT